MTINVNVEIINKIAGNALGGVILNPLLDPLKGSISEIIFIKSSRAPALHQCHGGEGKGKGELQIIDIRQ